MASPRTAYITGGASGIGRALTVNLLLKGWTVFIADRDVEGAKAFANDHNATNSNMRLHYAECDTKNWDSQVAAFKKALNVLNGRIDFVAPIAGIGERRFIPILGSEPYGQEGEFERPDLTVVDIDLTGVLYTVAIALQQFRRQARAPWPGSSGSTRGKIGLVASICGIYCVPALPIYTAAKHALIGLTRSYGKLLPGEGITVNAVAPNVVRTNISPGNFYDRMQEVGLLTSMDGLMKAFEDILDGDGSGEVYECGPRGGYTKRTGEEYLDDESKKCCEMLQDRAKTLHYT